jgi:tetratricopeptide (TPR) repeat protein
MVETLDKATNYRSYIRSLLKLFAYEDAGKDDSDEADTLREQMIEPWYALTLEERKRMDGLAEDLKELRTSRRKTWWRELSEKEKLEGQARLREVYELKSAGRFDEALDHLRKWKHIILPQFVWHFRGSCWNFMGIPEVAVEFYGEAARIDPRNEKFKGVYLMLLKKTNFQEAQKIAYEVMAQPEVHDLTLVVYAADVEAASINECSQEDGNEKTLERTRRLRDILEMVMQQMLAGEVQYHGGPVVGMTGMLLSSCYVTLGMNEDAFGLLTFLINLDPQNPLLYAARGKLNYPNSDESIQDLIRSIDFGIPMNWPFVWIATYYMEKGQYSDVRKTCEAAFARQLVPRIHSELLELLAIAEASSGASEQEVRDLFEQAIRTDVRNTRAVDNLNKFEELVQDPTRDVGWRRESSLIKLRPEDEEEKDFKEKLQKDLAIAA